MRAGALIFDLDGTLWDTNEVCAAGWNIVLARLGLQRRVTGADLRAVVGRTHRDAIGTALSELDEALLDRISDETALEDNRQLAVRGGRLFAGVLEWIPRLAERHALMIVSNCQAGYIEIFRSTSGLDDYFVDHECWGNTGRSKADNLASVIARSGARHPVFIGDTEGDRSAARENGVPFVHAAYGFGEVEEADARLESFEELAALLGGLG